MCSCRDKSSPPNECLVHATNRWKACRFGAGALFGDRPVQNRGTESENATPASEWTSDPALETAITAEETELLEIGVTSYRRYLAKGVRERTHQAVAVLQATEALVRMFGSFLPTQRFTLTEVSALLFAPSMPERLAKRRIDFKICKEPPTHEGKTAER